MRLVEYFPAEHGVCAMLWIKLPGRYLVLFVGRTKGLPIALVPR